MDNNTTIGSAITSYTSTIDNTMSMATINGSNLKDILKSGRDTATSSDTFKNITVSGLSAGITSGLTEYIDKNNNITKGIISKGNTTINPNATLTQQFTSKLVESSTSNITSTAIQSTINGDDFTESLKQQLINTIVMAGANYTANQIGQQYHTNNLNFGIDGTTGTVINKLTQLTLHAGLGALTNTITGNDALSGAVSAVSGEIVSDYIFKSLNDKYSDTNNKLTQKQFENNKNTATSIAGLVGGLSSAIVSKSQNKDLKDIISNTYSGQRIAENVSKNNSTNVKHSRDKDGNIINNKYRVIDAKQDGDTGIYNVEDGDMWIGETYSDTEFLNGTCKAGKCTIHLDIKIDFEGIADDADRLAGFLNLALESRTGGAYDLKNSLIDLGYTNSRMDGIVDLKTGVIMNGDTAGNYLYGVNTAKFGIGTYEKSQEIADFYHNLSNTIKNIKNGKINFVNGGEPQEIKNIIYNGYNSTTPNKNSGLNLIDLRIKTNEKNLENVRKNIK